jgi:hypothetical protein
MWKKENIVGYVISDVHLPFEQSVCWQLTQMHCTCRVGQLIVISFCISDHRMC